MASFAEDQGILFSGDAFGGFSIPPTLFDDSEDVVNSFMQFSRKYFITIIGHYRQHVLKGVEKLGKLGIKPRIIAPAYGLIWRRQPEKIVEAYRQWALGTPVKGKVVIVYFSAYDAVERVIGIIVDELTNRGLQVKTYGFTDVGCPILGNVLADIVDAEALVVGFSTYEASVSLVAEASLSAIESKAAYKKFAAVIVLYGVGASSWQEGCRET